MYGDRIGMMHMVQISKEFPKLRFAFSEYPDYTRMEVIRNRKTIIDYKFKLEDVDALGADTALRIAIDYVRRMVEHD